MRQLIVALLGVVLMMGATNYAKAVGLVAHWELDGNGNDSADSHDGTVWGATPTEDRFGNANSAMFFDGSNDYIDVTHHPDLTPSNAMTVTAWFKPSSFNLGQMSWPAIVKKYNGTQEAGYAMEIVQVWERTPKVGFGVGTGTTTGGGGLTIFPVEPDEGWYFYAGVYEYDGTGQSTLTTFFGADSQALQSGTTTFAGQIKDSETNLNIGRDNTFTNANRHFNGIIDDVRIYDEALTPEQVTGLYTMERPVFVPPQQPMPDPEDPPPEVVRNHFVVGIDPFVSVEPLTVGADFEFGVPGIGEVGYHPSFPIPEEPLSPEIDPVQFGFTTNEFLGDILRRFTPISETVQATGTLRLSGDADLAGELHLTEGLPMAQIEANVGAGVNLTTSVRFEGSLTDLPIVGNYLRQEISFPIPLVGTPTYEFSTDIPLPIPSDRTESILLGVTASVYAESSLTVGAELYLREETPEDFNAMASSDVIPGTYNEPVDWSSAPQLVSETGTVDTSGGDLRMDTGSSVWISSLITVTDWADVLFFEGEFASDPGAEGLLQVYWDGELIAMLDERESLEGSQDYLLALPGTYEAGVYSLSFRLDPHTAIPSSMVIDNVAYGHVVPEPSTIILLLTGAFGLLVYCIRRR